MFFNNMLVVWMLMEINTFSFFMFSSTYSMKKMENLLYVFFFQIFSSFFLILSIYLNLEQKDVLMFFAILIKMAFFPLFFWYFFLYNFYNKNLFILLTFQKTFVFILITLIFVNFFFFFFLLFSLLVVFLNFSQNLLKMIFIFSSLFHSCWMMMTFLFSKFIWLTYFVVYSFLLYYVLFTFLSFKDIKISFLKNNLSMIFILLSISSLPPFMMFLPKLYLIFNLQFFFLILLIFIVLTLLNITLYMRVLFFLSLGDMKMFKFIDLKNNFILYLIFANFFFLMFI
uniref:NADH-ubiquinone oxidoreductase chain 2 n=1 Tax=Echiniscus testudo TaxID=399800 RepID=A0A348BR65_ECHTS|nr:NADH dehydrogenase subunit 2 [Echiniscus testudo]